MIELGSYGSVAGSLDILVHACLGAEAGGTRGPSRLPLRACSRYRPESQVQIAQGHWNPGHALPISLPLYLIGVSVNRP